MKADQDTLAYRQELEPTPEQHGQTLHDIRASIAILNGFGDALGSSFQELSKALDDVIDCTACDPGMEAVGQIKTLQADCRFCLSRLQTATERLGLLAARMDHGPQNSNGSQ